MKITTTKTLSSNVASQINDHHHRCKAAAGEALSHAMAAGKLLVDAKESAGHGAWLPWLKQNCPDISERTAQTYMKLHDCRAMLESNTKRAADLSIRAATKMLAVTTPATTKLPFEFPEVGQHAHVILDGDADYLTVAPSEHSGFYFVAAFTNDGFGGASMEGNKKAMRQEDLITIFPPKFRQFKAGGDSGVAYTPGAAWDYNQGLYFSREEWINHGILGKGVA